MECECQRDSPESSWYDVSGREHVLAGRLCLLRDDSAPSSVDELEGKGGERGILPPARDEGTVTDGLPSPAKPEE